MSVRVQPWPVFTAVYGRTLRKTVRRPVILMFSFVQPIVWMTFFGFLFHRYRVERVADEAGYISFLLPGVGAMTVLFGASQSGIEIIRDLQTGFLQRMLLTRADSRLVLASKLAADVTRLLVQAVLIGLLGVLLGARTSISLTGLPVGLLALCLFAFALGSVSCAIALVSRNPEAMAVFVHLVNMPLLFTSTALVPERHMPHGLAVVSSVNPFSLVVNALRSALLFSEMPSVLGLLPLVVFAFVAFATASVALRRGIGA
jgi:ABC transporter DrrB family efflux protein